MSWYRLQLERAVGTAVKVGYGNNPLNRDNQQPSPKDLGSMGAVHRLDGSGPSGTTAVGLRYSHPY
jgi:hypothetical protein